MTKANAQKILTGILESPVDFIYLWASDSFIGKLSGTYRKTVYNKNVLQRKYINTLVVDAGYDYSNFLAKMSDKIVDTYGYKPADILTRLAKGQEVAGKNWKEGVYGVGAQQLEAFKQNASVTVDKSTGKLLQGGTEIAGQTAVYSSGGKVVGYMVTLDGNQYQSKKVSGSYYAGSFSTSDGVFNADGSAYAASNAESIFQNIFAYLPMFSQLLQWFFSLVGLTPITASKVTATQSDWVKTTDSSSDTLLLFVLGAGLVMLLVN